MFWGIYVCAYPIFVYKYYKLSSIYQDYKPKKNLSITKPPEKELKEWINYKKILKKQFGESLVNFVKVIKEKLPHVDLSYFYKNIKKIDVKQISEKKFSIHKQKEW